MDGVSVIICTYNGSPRLQRTLEGCLRQEATCDWELIVVDNASSDGSAALCEELLSWKAGSLPWKVVSEPVLGLNAARWRGISSASFDAILFCDDDNYLSDKYVQTGYDVMASDPAIGVLGGCGVPVFETERPAWFDAYSGSFAIGPQAVESGRVPGPAAAVYGAGAFFRKRPVLQHFRAGVDSVMSDRRGSSLASGGDVEWCYIVQLAGYQVWYDERLQFEHLMTEGRMSWEYYLRLKAGIASGTAKLLPYNTLLRSPGAGSADFLREWLVGATTASLICLKLLVTGRSRPTASPEDRLATAIQRAKARAYFTDGVSAFRQFTRLKEIQRRDRS